MLLPLVYGKAKTPIAILIIGILLRITNLPIYDICIQPAKRTWSSSACEAPELMK